MTFTWWVSETLKFVVGMVAVALFAFIISNV
jgi:hypothetical protein